MSDTPPPLVTEQSNSGSDDFEFIEKEEGIVSKGSYDAIPDLIQTTQKAKDDISTDQDSNLNNLVGLETGDDVSPVSDSLVIIEPEIPTQNTEEILAKDPENVEETAAKVDEVTLDSISKEDPGNVIIQFSEEISVTEGEISDHALPQDIEKPENVISKDHGISDDIPSENRKISDDTLPQDRKNPEDTISKDRGISDEIPSENLKISDDTLPQDRENPEDTILKDSEISEKPDSKNDEDDTLKNTEVITEIEPVINPKNDDDVIDKDDAEVMDILFSPRETTDSDLPDKTESPSYLQQQPQDNDITDIQCPDKQTIRNSSDNPDFDNFNSTKVTDEYTAQDGELGFLQIQSKPVYSNISL